VNRPLRPAAAQDRSASPPSPLPPILRHDLQPIAYLFFEHKKGFPTLGLRRQQRSQYIRAFRAIAALLKAVFQKVVGASLKKLPPFRQCSLIFSYQNTTTRSHVTSPNQTICSAKKLSHQSGVPSHQHPFVVQLVSHQTVIA
jgi:hypothetical protein